MYQRLQNEGEDDKDLRLLLIGKTGSGKSSTGNILFNDRVFVSKMSSSSVTRFCQKHTGSVSNRSVTVIDTPDFIFSTHTDFDSDSELKKALELCSAGAHVILLFLPLSTFSEHEKDFISWFEQKFGAEALRFTLVLFTHAFKTHQRPLKEIIRRNIELSDFINRCSGGFCGINITDPANRRQVTELMEKIDGMVSVITNSYTVGMMVETNRRREEEKKRAEKERREEEERRREEEMRERRREYVRREREHQMQLDRVRIQTEIHLKKEFDQKLEEGRAKILKNKEKAEKREKHSLLTQRNLKYAGVLMVFAVVTGGVSVWSKDSSHGWTIMRGFITGGSAAAGGVLTGIFWRLMLKNQFIRSSSHERPSAVRQLLLKAAGVVCGSSAGAVIHHFVGENLLHVSVSAGSAGAFTAIHWSP